MKKITIYVEEKEDLKVTEKLLENLRESKTIIDYKIEKDES